MMEAKTRGQVSKVAYMGSSEQAVGYMKVCIVKGEAGLSFVAG